MISNSYFHSFHCDHRRRKVSWSQNENVPTENCGNQKKSSELRRSDLRLHFCFFLFLVTAKFVLILHSLVPPFEARKFPYTVLGKNQTCELESEVELFRKLLSPSSGNTMGFILGFSLQWVL